MAVETPLSILFVCRDNSALSLMAEAATMHLHRPVRAFSAGLTARGLVDVAALECLHAARIPADGLSTKPVELFGFSGAPRIDLVVGLVEAVHAPLRRLESLAPARLTLWSLEDATHRSEAHARRLAYRRLLPELLARISDLVRGPGLASAA